MKDNHINRVIVDIRFCVLICRFSENDAAIQVTYCHGFACPTRGVVGNGKTDWSWSSIFRLFTDTISTLTETVPPNIKTCVSASRCTVAISGNFSNSWEIIRPALGGWHDQVN